MSIALVAFLLARSGVAFGDPHDPLVMKISIHDYTHLSETFVRRTEQHVTDLYASIGVGTEWADTTCPVDPGAEARPYGADELLVNILPAEMSERLQLPNDALGVAYVTVREGGRVAYIVFDRVNRLAQRWAKEPPQMLGLVIAHEIGHLLLPYGSHSPSGLMRPHWQLEDFEKSDGLPDRFTRAQAEGIRTTLGRRAKSAPLEAESRPVLRAGE
jgi:hypothetical protein